MIILTIRTDQPEAELGVYDGTRQLAYKTWPAGRELAMTIHRAMDEVLGRAGKTVQDVQGIACFKGPGSFTGLRIGLSVANALAYGLGVPVVARQNPQWLERGIADLLAGRDDVAAVPEYGSAVHTTPPKR